MTLGCREVCRMPRGRPTPWCRAASSTRSSTRDPWTRGADGGWRFSWRFFLLLRKAAVVSSVLRCVSVMCVVVVSSVLKLRCYDVRAVMFRSYLCVVVMSSVSDCNVLTCICNVTAMCLKCAYLHVRTCNVFRSTCMVRFCNVLMSVSVMIVAEKE